MAFNKDKVKDAIRTEVVDAYNARNSNPDLYSNTLDIFGAVIDSKLLRVDLAEWINIEKARQTQKTVQNTFGLLHQKIIGTVEGWEDLGKDGIVDVINKEKKIIGEIKNKHNTVTGVLRKTPYETLDRCINTRYEGFTSYFVEVLPLNRKVYDKPFMPSDNTAKLKQSGVDGRKPKNEKIRQIDGKSFYKLVTGKEDAIHQLYKMLPNVVDEILLEEKILKEDERFDLDKKLTENFYSKTYS